MDPIKSGQQVPVTRTVVTMYDYIRAIVRTWAQMFIPPCPKGAAAVLWAQHVIECGAKDCWNFNIGNVKSHPAHDYMCLSGVWEGVTPAVAAQLIASGRAVADPSPNHATAVGEGKVSVIFPPPQPESRFRAFTSLDEAMVEHLGLLSRRFARCWPSVVAGDVHGFAHALKAGPDGRENTWDDYFTADAVAYERGMQPAFKAAMQSNVWDDIIEEIAAEQSADTVPELPAAEVGPIVHPVVDTVTEAQRRDE
jgi:hypothetical protein